VEAADRDEAAVGIPVPLEPVMEDDARVARQHLALELDQDRVGQALARLAHDRALEAGVLLGAAVHALEEEPRLAGASWPGAADLGVAALPGDRVAAGDPEGRLLRSDARRQREPHRPYRSSGPAGFDGSIR